MSQSPPDSVKAETQIGGPRFGLSGLLIAVAGVAVLCSFLFVLLPELWALATEMPWVKKTLVAVSATVGVFVLIMAVGVVFRLGVLAVTGVPEKSTDESKRRD